MDNTNIIEQRIEALTLRVEELESKAAQAPDAILKELIIIKEELGVCNI